MSISIANISLSPERAAWNGLVPDKGYRFELVINPATGDSWIGESRDDNHSISVRRWSGLEVACALPVTADGREFGDWYGLHLKPLVADIVADFREGSDFQGNRCGIYGDNAKRAIQRILALLTDDISDAKNCLYEVYEGVDERAQVVSWWESTPSCPLLPGECAGRWDAADWLDQAQDLGVDADTDDDALQAAADNIVAEAACDNVVLAPEDVVRYLLGVRSRLQEARDEG